MNNNTVRKTPNTRAGGKKKKGAPKKGRKPAQQQKKSQKKKTRINSKRVPGAKKSDTLVMNQNTGAVALYTVQDKQQIAMATNSTTLPEEFVNLTEPNKVTWDNNVANNGVALNWEALGEGIIATCIAKNSGMACPGGPAFAKLYLFWCWISRMRLQRDQALFSPAGNAAQFMPPNWPEFNEYSYNVPVLWAKFIEYQMKYADPSTGTIYQYKLNWDLLTGNTQPTITGPSIQVQNLAAGNYFNRSVIGNAFLTQLLETTTGSATPQEQTFGLDPNGISGGLTNQSVFNLADQLSEWFRLTTTTTTMSKVPFNAPDGSLYSYVFSATSTYPGIVSNIAFVNSEASYLLHVPQTPVTGTQTRETFRYVDPIPPVLIDDAPTNVPVQAPAQTVFIINACYIFSFSKYRTGGLKTCIKTAQPIYPSLRSIVPNYYTLNLKLWHELVEQHIQVILNNTNMNNTQSQLSLTHLYGLVVAWESALLTRVMQFAFPSILFYTQDDIASNTCCSEQFNSLYLPPILADYIAGIGPIVVAGKLYIPLFDYRAPVNPLAFQYLTNAFNATTARWLVIADPPTTNATTNAQTPWWSVYIPTSTVTALNAPPSSLDRTQPYAYSLFNTAGVTYVLANLAITRLNILGPSAINPLQPNISDPVPGPNSVYAPATPWKYANLYIQLYKSAIQNSDSSFINLDVVQMGTFSQLSPVNVVDTSLRPFTQLGNIVATVYFMIDTYPKKVGALQPLDEESVGRCASYGYRLSGNVSNMPYVAVLAATTNDSYTLAETTVRAQGNNAWNLQMQNKMNKLPPIQAVRSGLATLFCSVCPSKGAPYHVGEAVAKVMKSTMGIYAAPYHCPSTMSVGTFNSPTNLEQGVEVAGYKATPFSGIFHMGAHILDQAFGGLFNILGV